MANNNYNTLGTDGTHATEAPTTLDAIRRQNRALRIARKHALLMLHNINTRIAENRATLEAAGQQGGDE